MGKRKYVNFLIGLLFCGTVYAQTPTDSSQVNTSFKRWKVLPLPTIGYAPETKGYLGAVALFTLHLGDTSLNRRSTMDVEFNYTQNNQMISDINWELNFGKGNWLTQGTVMYKKFPDLFWGIGNNTQEEEKESFESEIFTVDIQLQRKIYKSIYLGAYFSHVNEFNMTSNEENGLIKNQEILGTKDYQITHWGMALSSDNRKNILNPQQGHFLQVIAASGHYSEENLQKSNVRLSLDFRKYLHLFHSKNVLAFQLNSINNFGVNPFNTLAKIGSNSYMRGYYKGRYRDNYMLSVQAEYRFTIYKRWGATLFAGQGDVFDDWNNVSFEKSSLGGGLRFLIDRENNTNLRIDYAVGVDGNNGFYIGFGEAF
ncbi:BamA/TamA family outer membrane protein [Flammeovirga yaeyamensis]|uniref:BamA/TamA family outer membrane protein n=1 Tax=Flammeovirga yaeyamensis TaxID=367791 RepID=A0AAX1ND94_9BACT|nr:BamA/TamA family outer membrane protein [Flammeovirga yaeyamensis]MBB3699380.1 hypothetical protein [Flammeovirga yaeyamensis]NMF35360.1 BamA/TamA family outer membrane protein [Flammeovirga yaeyamensis]QWG04220.1 BamA/TamA family outer membrane protein [Flammeovirga yaeyamensis]